MKSLLVITSLLIGFSLSAQTLKFKVNGMPDTTVFLVKYYGKGMYYADTAVLKNGRCQFDGTKQKPGVLALLMPGQKYFDVIYTGEDVDIETSGPDYAQNLIVKKSEENKIFAKYVKYLGDQRKVANEIGEKRKKEKQDSEAYKKLGEEMDAVSKKVKAYQKEVVEKNKGTFVSKLVNMSMEIEIPDSPRDSEGKIIDSNFAYKYYRDHYFDHVDFTDDRVINTPIFHNKLDYFFSRKMLVQIPDTIVKYAFRLCDPLDQKSEMFKYCVTYITSTFEKSTMLNMDKVFQRMGERYYCSKNAEGKSPAYWMDDEKLKELCEKTVTLKRLVEGAIPPNVQLRDTTDKHWKDYYSLKSDYTILYFWDPDCGHCKSATPKLEKLYTEKLKARNVEVFAIAKAVGDDEFKRWKKFIKDKKLSFINVGLTDKLYNEAKENPLKFVPKYTSLESLNYQETFDIFSTPKVFLLDKDKKIVAKQLSISQLEDFLDHLQKVDAPKIIPADKEDEEKKVAH
ncbi:MAG: DUF5106 domain-containing protein [Bacteroidetes bacterium]|nr:MAG: DUF5106 domain-containing protein [Bacteroidota bacterium]